MYVKRIRNFINTEGLTKEEFLDIVNLSPEIQEACQVKILWRKEESDISAKGFLEKELCQEL